MQVAGSSEHGPAPPVRQAQRSARTQRSRAQLCMSVWHALAKSTMMLGTSSLAVCYVTVRTIDAGARRVRGGSWLSERL
jgi:hypothetical protein